MVKSMQNCTFFASMNTGEGFKSYFKEIFGPLERLYIIKGGPGTGKSRFMKEICDEAEKQGYITEKYLCSSDPTSLDGVIIPSLSYGIIDGTAPHTYEPFLTGAKDNIIDLGAFWNAEALRKHVEIINDISKRKTRLYSGIYSYLNAINCFDKVIIEAAKEAVYHEKMIFAAKKYTYALKNSDMHEKKIRIRSAISDSGMITLNSFSKISQRRYAVLDSCGVGGMFLSEILKETEKKGISATVSFSPFSPALPDAIYYPDSDTSFYIGSESDFEESFINTRRFIDDMRLRPYKAKIRALSRLKKDTMQELYTDFTSIKRLHGELEAIYGTAMDFNAKERFTKDFISTIFNR